MSALAATGAGFLMAVLWFDLMFDVQARGSAPLPDAALASIRAYYRRVTLEARMMSRLINVAMLVTVGTIAIEIATRAVRPWLAWPSLGLALAAIGTAAIRTVPNARRLGRGEDAPDMQTRLARSLLRDHVAFLAAMAGVAALQLAAGVWP